MPNSHQSDFKWNIRREVAGYFIVILCALPIRFWLYWTLKEQDGWLAKLASSCASCARPCAINSLMAGVTCAAVMAENGGKVWFANSGLLMQWLRVAKIGRGLAYHTPTITFGFEEHIYGRN